MNGQEGLAAPFEAHRHHLRGVAYRMLGSLEDADDAVQLAWLRADRADLGGIENLAGWLTTVVARVCLDMLRARRTRGGDMSTLVELLAPDVIRRADRFAVPAEVRGARAVADETRVFAPSPGPPRSRWWMGCQESWSHRAGDCSPCCA